MLASLKVSGWPLLAAVLGFAGGYRAHTTAPGERARECVEVASAPQAPALPIRSAGPVMVEGEPSANRAAAMSSGVVSGGEFLQPLPP